MKSEKQLVGEAENITRILSQEYSYREKIMILEMAKQSLMYAKFRDLLREDSHEK